MTSADLYLRLSDFRDGNGETFAERETALRKEAARLSWDVRRVVIENDADESGRLKPASAFKRQRIVMPDGRVRYRVIRPGFQSVLDDLMTGRAQAVLAEDLDRVAREPRDM